MTQPIRRLLSRRRALAFGGGLVVAGPATVSALARGTSAGGMGEQGPSSSSRAQERRAKHPPAPPTEVFERELHTKGTVSENVLSIEIPRGDLHHVKGPRNLIFTPSWELHHDWSVQTLPSGETMLNGEMSLLGTETGRVVRELLAQGLVFQAFHQHFTSQVPQIWHIHMRGRGEARKLAQALAALIRVTATPFPPPKPPGHPTTPLDAKGLARILGGTPHVMEDGVVTVDIPRKNPMRLGGEYISPNLAIAPHVRFKPLHGTDEGTGANGPNTVAAAPDFGMTADEVQKVIQVMDEAGWGIDCLYNQETDEFPQLYWSHQLKVGDATRLAHEIRRGLDQMNLDFKS